MSDSGTPRRPEDFVVAEVSSEVLAELSELFGPSSDGEAPDAEQSTDMTTAIDETPTEFIEEISLTKEVEAIAAGTSFTTADESEVVVIGGDFVDESSPTPGPADPLIIGMNEGTFIGDDDSSTLVVIADNLDHVVIVDDDRPDPTFEERRRRQARRERLQRVKWFKLAGVVVGFIVFIMAVLASPLFAIRSVTLEGNVYTSKETLEKVRDSLKGASVFTVDSSKARAILLDDPWVADVRITTHFPSRALVEIAERKPVVWYIGDDQKARIIDARGRVIAVLEGFPTKYLQVVGTGPALDAGAVADEAYRAAAQLVLALPDEIQPRVKSLELSAGGELSMVLKTGTLVRFGLPNDLQNKLVAVVVLLRRQDPATLAVVDVSTGIATVRTK